MSNEQKALLGVLIKAISEIRNLGYEGKSEGLSSELSERVADLAEITHNIPSAIENDASWDMEYFVKEFTWFQEKHPDYRLFRPLDMYSRAIARFKGEV